MAASVGSISLLHVDDEPGFAEMTAAFLERRSDRFRVTTATSPKDAAERLAADGIDCIVSDYDMPGENGIEFLERVRSEYGDIPFILFTGKGSEEVASDAISAGVSDYLQKNGGTDQYEVLANRVENLVGRYRAERRMETYLETSPDGIVVAGRDGVINRVNRRVEELFGYDRAELVGEPIEVLVPERFREAHVADREGYAARPTARPMGAGRGLSGRHRDGTEVPVDVSLSPMYLEDGLEVIASIRDATDRRHREATLVDLSRINRTVRETTQAVVRADTHDAVLRTVCEELAGSDPYVFAWTGAEVDGEVRPTASAGVEEGYLDAITVTADETATGAGPTGRAVQTRTPQATQDLQDAPAFEPWRRAASERGYQSSAAIPLVYDDTLYGVLSVYADRPGAFDDLELEVLAELGTTVAHALSRIELTGELERMEELHRTILSNVRETVFLTDEAGRFTYVSPSVEYVFGYDPAQVTDLGTVEALFGERPFDQAALEASGELRNLETTVTDADGEAHVALVSVRKVDIEDGTTLYSVRDISERKESQRRLEAQNERLDAFASVLSHDLRNPLSVAKGSLELARERHSPADFDRAESALDRMEALVEDLLTLAREGEAATALAPVALADLVRDCWETVETGDATLAVETDRTVVADASRLRQLLENLVRNAVEHADDGVTVTVGDLEDGFYVADDGPGIPEGVRETVFESGYSTTTGGTGFGLAIVSAIVEAHGWDVRVTGSETGGARFEVRGVETPDG
jgi:PAS domain S-box-containing protein